MKIAFSAGTLSYRGTHVAIQDYAYFNQQLLGHESLICIDAKDPGPADLVQKLQSQYECLYTSDWANLSEQCLATECAAVYIIKSGEQDLQLAPDLPNLVHAVFPQPIQEQHGHVYAFVSEWLSLECTNAVIPFVPHMIKFPNVNSHLRAELQIPIDATVIGCYGGYDSFDITFVQQIIREFCASNNNYWFIFMNIRPFTHQDRVLFLPASADSFRKREFINTCDAMLHARGMGESFGLACGEFSSCNKPVITYGLSPQRAHLHMLGDKALVYRGPSELRNCLRDFDRQWASQQNWDQYSKPFGPESVMAKFSDVFLKPLSTQQFIDPLQMSWIDFAHVEWSKSKRRFRSHSRKFFSKYG